MHCLRLPYHLHVLSMCGWTFILPAAAFHSCEFLCAGSESTRLSLMNLLAQDWPRHRKHCTGAGERTWAEATHEAERLSELEGLQAGMSDGVRSTSEQTEETAYTVIDLLAHPEMGK